MRFERKLWSYLEPQVYFGYLFADVEMLAPDITEAKTCHPATKMDYVQCIACSMPFRIV